MLSPMKFLLECVSCYGTTATRDPPLPKSAQPESPRSPSEDSVPTPSGALRRRSRSLSRLGPGDWKPSLHAISEDNVAAPAKSKAKAKNQMTRAASERRSGRRCGASTPPRVRSGGRTTNSYGGDHVPMIVPTFAPIVWF